MADKRITELGTRNTIAGGDLFTFVYDNAGTFTNQKIDFTNLITQIEGSAQHNNLQSLQGGTSGEYYHLTQQQHTDVTSLTSSEYSQLANIDSVTISNAQWGYLGGLDQSLSTGDSATFTQLTVTPSSGDGDLNLTSSVSNFTLRAINASADRLQIIDNNNTHTLFEYDNGSNITIQTDSTNSNNFVLNGNSISTTQLGYVAAMDQGVATSDDVTYSSVAAPIVDSNGNLILGQTSVASAVNYVDITNAATGNAPILQSAGTDTNIGLTLQTSGTGNLHLNAETILVNNALVHDGDTDTQIAYTADAIDLQTGGSSRLLVDNNRVTLGANLNLSGHLFEDGSNNTILDFQAKGSAVNFLRIANSATANNVIIDTLGGDTDVNLELTTKNAGTIDLNAATVGVAQDLVHLGDTDNKLVFGTDTQDFQTGGSSRLDINNSGVRVGATGARITEISDDTTLADASSTAGVTENAVKTYVDNQANGQLIQIKQASTESAFSTSSTTLVDVTGLSVSITPSATANDIMIQVFAPVELAPNDAGDFAVAQLLRGSTALSTTSDLFFLESVDGTNSVRTMFSLTFVDTPATTSSTTYKLQTRVSDGSSTLTWMINNGLGAIIVSEIEGGLA